MVDITRGTKRDISKSNLRTVKHGRIASAEMKAWAGAMLEKIRGGIPSQVSVCLNELIEDGHIAEEQPIQETEAPDDELLENDSELKAEDEDDVAFDLWGRAPFSEMKYNNEICLGGGNIFENIENDPFMDNDYFELSIEGDICLLSVPDWANRYRGITNLGESAVYEGDCRVQVLGAIAVWLQTERLEFLKDNSWLNLGPKDYKEVISKVVTVKQDSFLDFLGERIDISGIDKSKFSRYLDASRIVWPEGSISLKELFSKEARMGWVARSVTHFMKVNNISDHPQENIKKPRDGKERTSFLEGSVDSMDLGEFVVYLNLVAQTSWKDVCETYFKERSNENGSTHIQ